MSWESAGTVTLTKNSTTITGAGTLFGAKSRVGDAFISPSGALYEVVNIVSDTVLSISPSYAGETEAGVSYKILPIPGYQKKAADRLYKIMNQLTETADITGDINAVLDAINGETV